MPAKKTAIAKPLNSGRQDARSRLMDAAERLFAERGFNGTSVRQITEVASTRLADINDHFGSKESLFVAVVGRRASVVNAGRMERLQKLPPTGTLRVKVTALVDAFAMPMLAQSKISEGWRHYFRLVAQINHTRTSVLVLIADQFNPIAHLFISELARLFPSMSLRQLMNTYQFMVSSVLTVFANNFRIDVLTESALHSADFEQHYADMVHFVVAGVLGIGQQKAR